MWGTVHTKDVSGSFQLTGPEPTEGTFCVWELGVVNHERLARTTYRRSRRTDSDRRACLADRHSGPVRAASGADRQRGGPTITLPYFSEIAGSGLTSNPSGRGVLRSRPVSRNMPSMPAGVFITSRSARSDVIR